MSIVIPPSKLRDIEQTVMLRALNKMHSFGGYSFEEINIKDPLHYAKLESLSAKERKCQYIGNSAIHGLLDFRKALMDSNFLSEERYSLPEGRYFYPLSQLVEKNCFGDEYDLHDDDLTSFIQTQHKHLNAFKMIEKDNEVLREGFDFMGLSDFDGYVDDILFLWAQRAEAIKWVLEAVGFKIIKTDEDGRILGVKI